MKRLTFLFVAMFATLSLSAQYYPDFANKDMLHIRQPRTTHRTEIKLPVIDGYTPYKADLHNHTIFSDGGVSMAVRVSEAWTNGIDVLAVTEHLEYRPHENDMVKYLKDYTKNGPKVENTNFVSANRPASAEGIHVDLNYPVEVARRYAEAYGMTIISGIEITRKEEGWYSHFNVLFSTDNNAIYAPETLESIRNAKKQGALVMHNHPGWRHDDMKITKFEKKVYDAGLLDGIEVMNGSEFYPQAIDRAHKYNLFVSSNTDAHNPTAERYGDYGELRNMTIIYAKDQSLESLREAIEARRTIAYSFGTIAGEESLLRKFFGASVSARKTIVRKNGVATVILTNNSSVDWLLKVEGEKKLLELSANSSIALNWNIAKPIACTVYNAWHGENKQLAYELKVE